MAKYINFILAAIVVLLGYSNYQQGNKIAELYEKNASLNAQLNQQVTNEGPGQTSGHNLATALTQQNTHATHDNSSSTVEPDSATGLTDSSEYQDADNSSVAELAASDEVKEVMQSDYMKQQIKYQLKNQLPPLYDELFEQLQLDDEQRKLLLDLLVEDKFEATQFAMAFAYNRGEALENIEEYQSSDEYKQNVEALIGTDGMSVLTQYEETLPVRQEMMMLNAQMPADQSLSKAQISMMIDSVSQVRKSDTFQDNKTMMALVKEGNIEEARMMLLEKQQATLEQSANILSAHQQASYQSYLDQQLEMQLVSLKMMVKM
ncbi:hypothetical protein LP316_04845 [Thalassotalea sp. LPB0316]|uniref:hypothetical protein n=1 Tax=Thalassotalea sp. LPB0316 TaxID=2769490 RepID=UPI00186686E5|nr:hypothetical protein [Thalassotalea sp. LPB0316]QOL26632.1 hypothetical protein LP316_04845 [Thalassotalea sp. LPB0316]